MRTVHPALEDCEMNMMTLTTALALICSIASARAEVVVYQEKCGLDAKANYNLLCQVERNTLEDYIGQVKSIVICTSYDNHGGMHTPIIVHNQVDRTDAAPQQRPTDMFDTVKFHGRPLSEPDNAMSWDGTGSREQQGVTMHGDARWTTKEDSKTGTNSSTGTYTEVMLQGRRQLGEIRTRCIDLPGAGN
jgi:hypothetical protein